MHTGCPKGHPFDDENTYIDGHGWRHCQICRRENNAKYYREEHGIGSGRVALFDKLAGEVKA